MGRIYLHFLYISFLPSLSPFVLHTRVRAQHGIRLSLAFPASNDWFFVRFARWFLAIGTLIIIIFDAHKSVRNIYCTIIFVIIALIEQTNSALDAFLRALSKTGLECPNLVIKIHKNRKNKLCQTKIIEKRKTMSELDHFALVEKISKSYLWPSRQAAWSHVWSMCHNDRTTAEWSPPESCTWVRTRAWAWRWPQLACHCHPNPTRW